MEKRTTFIADEEGYEFSELAEPFFFEIPKFHISIDGAVEPLTVFQQQSYPKDETKYFNTFTSKLGMLS